MKSRILTAIFACLILSASVFAGTPRKAPENLGAELDKLRFFTGNIQTGYYDGVGIHVSGTFANFAEGFPFGIRFGIGHAWIPCGDPVLARRIFIDQNTGGNNNARAQGDLWDYRLDLIYPVKVLSLERGKVFGGVRYTDFNAYFEYIGGNETFDVINNEWGLGGGIETAFALSPLVDLTFSLGVDYFFRGELSGHDTYYRPDGSDLNSKENFTYADADAAINDPNVNARLMMGVAYRF